MRVRTNVTRKTQISYRIREEQLAFMRKNDIQRSPWLRQRLKEAMTGQKKFPTGNQRRQNVDLVPTSSLISSSQKDFVEDVNMNISQYIDNEIDALMNQYSQ